jgi:hypothetical protein
MHNEIGEGSFAVVRLGKRLSTKEVVAGVLMC